jgi:DNA-binding NtrC family response regulator/predicted ATPase
MSGQVLIKIDRNEIEFWPAMGVLTDLLGQSPGIIALREKVERLLCGRFDSGRLPAVLLEGETGTGKGLLARGLHVASPRAHAPFIDVNCAAIPETMLEAELFGFERGAFTDARHAKPGLFQAAHRGTLFLDEIGLMSSALQAKLLKALEEKTVRRLGSTRSEPADAWVLSATNENLAAALRERRFREDLYHRLAVITLTLPPLRMRDGDVLLLAEHFLERACTDYGLPPIRLTASARAALTAYPWPGNIRELNNVIERAALLAETSALEAGHFALTPTGPGAHPESVAMPPDERADGPRQQLERALAATGWNISRTAEQLGLTRNTVKARIARYGLGERPRARRPPAAVEPPAIAGAVEDRAVSQREGVWELRRLTLMRVHVAGDATHGGGWSPARYLDVARVKLLGFGGHIEGAGVRTLLAVFGLDTREEPAVVAAHSGLVIRNAAQALSPDVPTVPVSIGLHTAEIPVRVGAGRTMIDADASRREWTNLETAMERAHLGDIVATAPAAAFLRRRFVLAPDEAMPTVSRIQGLWRVDPRARAPRGVLLGRRDELALLEARLDTALTGRGQVVAIAGESGIGKSRLVLELASGSRASAVRCLEGRCFPSESHTPFYPLLQIVRAASGVTETDSMDAIEEKVCRVLTELAGDTSGAVELCYLLGARPDPPEAPGPVLTRRLFRAVQRLLSAYAQRHPLLVIVEDLHWVDPTSDACLGGIVDMLENTAVLLVTTFRIGYQPTWLNRAHAVQFTLPPMSEPDSLALIRRFLAPTAWPEAIERNIQARAGGNPLFLEELSLAARDRGSDQLADHVPATVEETIASRLAGLPPRPRRLLSVAAVIGRDLPLRLLWAVADLDEEALETTMGELRRADFLHESLPDRGGPAYVFRHALVQETAYGAIVPRERASLHVRVLDALEAFDPAHSAEHVERLAHHAVRGEDAARAVHYLLMAGRKAMGRSALSEAINHLDLGLEILRKLPRTSERDQRELTLRIAIGLAFGATKGWAAPETDQAFERARAISQGSGNDSQLGPVLVGRWVSTLLRAQYREAQALADELAALAADGSDPLIGTVAHRALGMTAMFRGDFLAARHHLEHGVELYRPDADHARAIHDYGGPPHVSCLAFLGRPLWSLGYPDRGLARNLEAVKEARTRGGALSIATALGLLTGIHQLRADAERTRAASEASLAHASEWGTTYWAAYATILRRWAEARCAPPSSLRHHAAVTRTNLEHYQQLAGTTLGLTWFLTLLAELHGASGEPLEGLRAIDEALVQVEKTGERYHEAEIHRVRGELILIHDPDAAIPAETSFRRALEIARAQHAKGWELRTATSLARFLRARDRADEAYRLLASVYEWFTEGFETADLLAAGRLLDEMRPSDRRRV